MATNGHWTGTSAQWEETSAQWALLPDGESAQTSLSHRLWQLAKISLMLTGLVGLVAIAVLSSSSPAVAPDAVVFIEHDLKSVPEKKSLETAVRPSQITQVMSVASFNELIASSIVIDAKELFNAMSHNQRELLFMDFLAKIGSQAPHTPGQVPDKRSKYASNNEHSHRFGVFENTILTVLTQNAEEHKRNVDSNRARFGITVHADWVEDEFVTTRLSLRSLDRSKYEMLLRKFAPEAPKADKNDTNFPTPIDLANDQCRIVSGSCAFFDCPASEGTTCFQGQCVCTDGACLQQGTCLRPGNCHIATGGSCHLMNCWSDRHAMCKEGSCICPVDSCARDGACVTDTKRLGTGTVKCSAVYSTPIRNQGACGGCWAFSAGQQLRYMAYAKYNKDPGPMSAQYLLDCMPEVSGLQCLPKGVKGCCGSLPTTADYWLRDTGGLPTESDYGPSLSDKHPTTPYKCKAGKKKSVAPIGQINLYQTETDIANAMCNKGPVSLAIWSNANLQHYIGGIVDVKRCPVPENGGINHAVLYVGVDALFDAGRAVHVILNSWGENWGVSAQSPYAHGVHNGHVLFKFGENVCNMRALATGPDDVELL